MSHTKRFNHPFNVIPVNLVYIAQLEKSGKVQVQPDGSPSSKNISEVW